MRVHSTIAMLRRHQIISLMLLLVAILSGCASEQKEVVEQPVVIEDDDHIELAFASLSSISNAKTRLADNIVQSGTAYRNIIGFNIIALKDGDPYNAEIDICELSDLKTDNTKFYHFDYCYMPRGTNNCLVYAKAMDIDKGTTEATSKYNGSLNAVMSNNVTSTSDIHFEPVPIYEDVSTVPAEATALGNALTKIVNDVPEWAISQNSYLQNLYSNFTNREQVIPGSAASVKQWMQSLSDAAAALLNNPPTSLGDDEKVILGNIKIRAAAAAAAITVDATSYPRNINLPDGAAALRWTEVEEQGMTVNKFVPQLQTTTLDNINSVSRFVYPPALYYFVNSGLWTSNSKIEFDDYKGKSTWKATTENDPNAVQTLFTDGGTIQSRTKTVAVADPLQYAVAQLQVKVKANDVNLKYAEDSEKHDITIPINDGDAMDYFRLTGVIIDGQRPVDYKFEQTNNLDSDVKFVFDSQVPENFYLTTTDFDNADAKAFNTLVLQSYDGEDVKIILEFEYVGKTVEGEQVAQAFKCFNGYVYPGTRFYLVGKVDLSQAIPPVELTDEEKTELKKRVFTQDNTTMVQMTVTSLEKAYNVLPSILSKNLEIGVMTTPKWIFATPPDPVIMD